MSGPGRIGAGLAVLALAVPVLAVPALSSPFHLPKEVLIVCAAFAGLLAASVSWALRTPAEAALGVEDLALGLYLAWSALGGLWATDPFLWKNRLLLDVALGLVYWAARAAAARPAARDAVLRAVSVAAVVVTTLGLLEISGVLSLYPRAGVLLSTLGYPNFVSQLLLVSLPVLLREWARAGTRLAGGAWAVAAGAALYVDFRSFSRAAWLATLLSLLVLARLWRRAGFLARSRRGPTDMAVLVTLMGLAVVAAMPLNLSPIGMLHASTGTSSYDRESKEVSILNRIEIWTACARLIRQAPLGAGAGNLEAVYPRFRTRDEILLGKLHQRYAHNAVLHSLVERGWPGFLLLLSFLLLHARRLWRLAAGDDSPDPLLPAVLAAALCGMVADGLFSQIFEMPATSFLLFLLLGVTRAVDISPPPGEPAFRFGPPPSRLLRLTLVASLAALCGWSAFDGTQRLRADLAHGRALRALSANDGGGAAALFRAACALAPGKVEYRFDCARSSLLEGDLRAASEHAAHVVARAPYVIEARSLLADALNELGNQAGARGDWSEAARLYTRSVETLQATEGVSMAGAQERTLSRYLSNAFYNRGNAHYWLGRLDDAARDYEAAVRFDRTNALALSGLGDVRLREGRRDEAREAYERARRLRPEDPRLRARMDLLH